MLKKRLLILFFLFTCVFAYAQPLEVEMKASVDKTEADVSEDIQLTITVRSNSTSVQVPQMPSLPNFNIYSVGQSRNVFLENGKVSAVQTYDYILSPRFPGVSTIEPFTITSGSEVFKTNPIIITVTRAGSGNAQASLDSRSPAKPRAPQTAAEKASTEKRNNTAVAADYFMTAETDKTEAFLDEQVNLTIRFYQARNAVGNPQYERPKMEGLVFEELKGAQDIEELGGKRFAYTEFNSALFGVVPGKASVGEAAVYYVPENMNPFNVFLSGLADNDKVSTAPINIKIKPLPEEGKTKTFYGAVGTDYTISAELDKKSVPAGEPLTLSVKITGYGNVKGLGDLPSPDLGNNFRVYNSSSSSQTKAKGSKIYGEKTYKTILVPRVSGRYELPAMDFTYFDTISYKYKTINAKSIIFDVTPGVKTQNSGVNFAQDASPSSPAGVEKISSDINYVKDLRPGPISKFTDFINGLGNANYFIFVIVIFGLLYNIFSREEVSILGGKRFYISAKTGLSKAKSVTEVSAILKKYIEAKMRAPIGIMTVSETARKLNLGQDTAKDLESLWQEFEMLKYAPPANLTNSIAVGEASARTLELIKRLEKEIK